MLVDHSYTSGGSQAYRSDTGLVPPVSSTSSYPGVVGVSAPVLVRQPAPVSATGHEALLRAEAGARLVEVLAGAPPRPLSPGLSKAMAQVAFRARHRALDDRENLDPQALTDGRLVRVFLALLAHPDLEEADLAWVSQDHVVSDPLVLSRVLGHPSCTIDVVVSAARHALWRLRGAVDVDSWARSSPALPILHASGPWGQGTSLMLSLWQDDDPARFAQSTRRLLTNAPSSVEVLSTLTSDFRFSHRRSTFCLTLNDLGPLLDQAMLLSKER